MWPPTQSFRIVSTNLASIDRCQAAWHVVPEIFFGDQFTTDLMRDTFPAPCCGGHTMPTAFQLFHPEGPVGLQDGHSLLLAVYWHSPGVFLHAFFYQLISKLQLQHLPLHVLPLSTNSFMSHTTSFLFPDAPFTP